MDSIIEKNRNKIECDYLKVTNKIRIESVIQEITTITAKIVIYTQIRSLTYVN